MASSTLTHPKHSSASGKRAKKVKAKVPPKKQKGRKRENHKFGLPVREAKQPLSVPLLQVDIEKAVKTEDVNDEQNFLSCVVAQAVTRVCGAERVWIGRKTAYVAFPGDGHTNRYEVNPHARDTLERWDRGEHIAEGIEVCLKPPGKKRSRAAMRKTWRQNKQWHKKDSGRQQRSSDPLRNVVRNGNLVRWG